jgi:GNAT superfamily N-acetyltransferase
MDKILENLSSPSLISALEANMIKYWINYGTAPGRVLYEGPDFIRFITGLPFTLFNGVFRAQLSLDTVDSSINEVIQSAAQWNVPLNWYIGPTTLPMDLGNHLLRQGFEYEGEMPVMAVELTKLQEPHMPANFSIRPVPDIEGINTWIKIVATGFGFPEQAHSALADLELSLGVLPDSVTRRYVGYQNGVPVATSELVLEAGVAGIYAVTTLPEARRQGIGANMTALPLIEARSQGYKIGTLQASSMGHPVYRQLGFQDLYKFELYSWHGHKGVMDNEKLNRTS